MLNGAGRLNGAFAAIRNHRRPLVANFAFAGSETAESQTAVQLANRALAEAFFAQHRSG